MPVCHFWRIHLPRPAYIPTCLYYNTLRRTATPAADCNIIISSGGSRIGGNAMTFPVKVFCEGFVILHATAACVQSAMGFTRRTPHSRTTTTTVVAATTIAAITTADTVAVLPQDQPTGIEPDALWNTFRLRRISAAVTNRSHTCYTDVFFFYSVSQTRSPLLRRKLSEICPQAVLTISRSTPFRRPI